MSTTQRTDPCPPGVGPPIDPPGGGKPPMKPEETLTQMMQIPWAEDISASGIVGYKVQMLNVLTGETRLATRDEVAFGVGKLQLTLALMDRPGVDPMTTQTRVTTQTTVVR